tara:strand:+ start:32 stop:1180 length:1149 start_codon:yes stop_codon:yes gene_type:complete
MNIEPDYKTGISKLNYFIENNLQNYSRDRNYDFGPDNRNNISLLSPYISHRTLFEYDIVKSCLKKYKVDQVEKFIQEIFWRVYWKGWLELRPEVWTDFCDSYLSIEQSKFYKKALDGNTGIRCFDEWVNELKEYNYLHNHSRMWFASIWIFTLKLPWQLGAAFFMEHLYDGDPASNTLSWRWVAGIQTKGKHYLARSSNISKFTNQRFQYTQLTTDAEPIFEDKNFELKRLDYKNSETKHENLIIFESNLNTQELSDLSEKYKTIYFVLIDNHSRKIKLSHKVMSFKASLVKNVSELISNAKIINLEELEILLSKNPKIDVIYPFVGENLDILNRLSVKLESQLNFKYKNQDLYSWQFSNKGFFNFKKNIPNIINKFNLSHE